MLVLLATHLLVVVLVVLVGDRGGRHVFGLAAVPLLATTGWALAGSPSTAPEVISWVPSLQLEIALLHTPFARLMTLIVGGVGVLVMGYAGGYFRASGGDDPAAGTARLAATLVAFAAAMFGVVWADNLWTLFIFWEATSITSFLLVGHKFASAGAVTAARRALVITGAGGLSLLVALVVLADRVGTTRLSELAGSGIDLGSGEAAVISALFLGAIVTKSAQFPFHVWLPGAMAAPTPVSAYLHSATMVKAGVVLMAVMSPLLAPSATWSVSGLVFGGVSVFWGALGALRQRDAKLILAWGTVSQLGLMIALLSVGVAKATFAAMAIIVSHALFKAALFMVVGEIDQRFGTRDVYELAGRARGLPWARPTMLIAAASMVGLPPTLGFAAKEAAVEASLVTSGGQGIALGLVVIGGSILTVAYTVRLLWLLFAVGVPHPAEPVARSEAALFAPAAILSLAGLAGFVGLGRIDGLVRPAAAHLDPGSAAYQLYRWPGFTTALMISAGVLVAGALAGRWAARRSPGRVPRPLGSSLVDGAIDGVNDVARFIAARVQHGSLPLYLTTMAAVATAAAAVLGLALGNGLPLGDDLRLWNSPEEGVIVVLIAVVAVAACGVGSRLGAAMALGGVGLGVTALFALTGAPDLALTQLLVETIVIVGFVMAFGHLTQTFPPAGRRWRMVRIAVAGGAGAAVTAALLAAGSARTHTVPVADLAEAARVDGGGNNVVNVILTDVRALDTFGEVAVLAVVALGLLALADGSSGTGRLRARRSPVLRAGVSVAAPFAILLGTYLFFAGHNRPGGGFAAGLVFGTIIAAGLAAERLPLWTSEGFLAVGLILLAATALGPLVMGETLLDQSIGKVDLPVLGTAKVGTALVFDAGVTAVVVGLVVAVLRGFGVASLGVPPTPRTRGGEAGSP